MKKLGLINYEGDCLKAIIENNEILIWDQYGEIVQKFDVPQFYGFIDGLINVIDSKGKSWNYPGESKDAKPSYSMIYHFVKDLGPDKTKHDNVKDELINLLESQVMDLTMMSKIELGDDVIHEIIRLKNIIRG